MKLCFERTIASSPKLVWSSLCEPERMNRWSSAKVKIVSTGEGDHPGGPGTHRRVTIRLGRRKVVLDEVIRDAIPGKLLIYEVIDNPLLRSHRGTITLAAEGDATKLRWHVDYTCSAPGVTRLIARVLRTQLGQSLDGLTSQLESNPAQDVSLPSWNSIPQPSDALWSKAREVHSSLQELAFELDAKNDPKSIFPHIYSFVSEGILQGCERGDFVYPSWPLHLLPVFYEYYYRNYLRWCGTEAGAVEPHWQRAFAILDGQSSRYSTPSQQLLGGLALSVHAHVESDLPRTFAEVYVDHFAQLCHYNRFRGDYYGMGKIFVNSLERVMEVIPADLVPAWARLARRALPPELMQMVAYRKAYNLPKHRRAAFRRGAELSEMLLTRQLRTQTLN
tara:strand:+ start:40206 stop:41378 length:1173 start_codon:yes stop_codon:yes gene_type:complete